MMFPLLCGLVLLIPYVAAQEEPSLNKTPTICTYNYYIPNCAKRLPPIANGSLKGIPVSKRDLYVYCSAFKSWLGCVDEFAKKCLTGQDRQALEDHFIIARHTFKFLCDDPVFQAEYVQYTSCYEAIKMDWDDCAYRFISRFREEVSHNNDTMESRLIELCWARHGFLWCVYEASRLKCKKAEAVFIKKIADTLSNMIVDPTHCRNEDVAFCSGGGAALAWHSFPYWLILLLLAFVK